MENPGSHHADMSSVEIARKSACATSEEEGVIDARKSEQCPENGQSCKESYKRHWKRRSFRRDVDKDVVDEGSKRKRNREHKRDRASDDVHRKRSKSRYEIRSKKRARLVGGMEEMMQYLCAMLSQSWMLNQRKRRQRTKPHTRESAVTSSSRTSRRTRLSK